MPPGFRGLILCCKPTAMNYVETELIFVPQTLPAKTATRSFGKGAEKQTPGKGGVELLGIRLRLGNRPLVYSLTELARQGGKPAVSASSQAQEYYLVVHAMSAMRTRGNASVEELQYFASAVEPSALQTIDLFPKTRFHQLVHAGLNLESSLDLFGGVSLDVPSGLAEQLIDGCLYLGPGLQLQLSASARFIGRFVYSLQIPVVQAVGVGSNTCSWILKPNEQKTPLLGDQLLVQSIAVPKGTKSIRYKLSGLVKADKGLFWKQQQQGTPEHVIEVQLQKATSQL